MCFWQWREATCSAPSRSASFSAAWPASGTYANVGSGNIGATNVLRTGRKDIAAATLLLDGGKGTLAVAAAAYLAGPTAGLVAGVAAVAGHCTSIWMRGNGGKGVATGLGMILGTAWPVGIASCAIWLASARLVRRSSAAALVAFAAAPVLMLPWFGASPALAVAAVSPDRVCPPPRQHTPPAGRHRAAHRTWGVTPAESLDRLRLARTDGVGPVTYRRLLRRYATAAEAIDALPGLARAGGKTGTPDTPSISVAKREMDKLARLGGRMVFLDGPGYPPALAAFDPAPPLLSVLGNAALLLGRAVALVGARNASVNGQRMAELLAADLATAGLVVVSGMARGIDAAAHEGALRTGRTVAAIAGGVDVTYPPENADLQRRVAEGGAVVAEAPLGTAPQARHFPRRNRVIAGLSLGVVVIEAAPRSGSLITAQIALDEGRAVFAVPGSPLDPRCRGSNNPDPGGRDPDGERGRRDGPPAAAGDGGTATAGLRGSRAGLRRPGRPGRARGPGCVAAERLADPR